MRILLSMNERRAARAARAQRSRKYRPDLEAVCEAVHTGAALAATTRRDGYSILMAAACARAQGFPIAIAIAAARNGNGSETAARNQTNLAGMNGISHRIMRWKANSAQATT